MIVLQAKPTIMGLVIQLNPQVIFFFTLTITGIMGRLNAFTSIYRKSNKNVFCKKRKRTDRWSTLNIME